jgi:hypothetical protein
MSEPFKLAVGNDKPVMTPARMRLAEYDRQDWVANVEFGVDLEDILDPGYWAHMAAQLKPYDHIEARAEDGTWVADLVVLGADRTWAKVALKQKYNLSSKDVSQTQAHKHTVEWKGPQHRFAVVRSSDSAMLKSGLQTKEDAAEWLKGYEQAT